MILFPAGVQRNNSQHSCVSICLYTASSWESAKESAVFWFLLIFLWFFQMHNRIPAKINNRSLRNNCAFSLSDFPVKSQYLLCPLTKFNIPLLRGIRIFHTVQQYTLRGPTFKILQLCKDITFNCSPKGVLLVS